MTMGKGQNNNITGNEEAYWEFGLWSGLWILREQFESQAGVMM